MRWVAAVLLLCAACVQGEGISGSEGETGPLRPVRFEVLDTGRVEVSWRGGSGVSEYVYETSAGSGGTTDTFVVLPLRAADIACIRRSGDLHATDSICNRVAKDSLTGIPFAGDELHIWPDSTEGIDLLEGEQFMGAEWLWAVTQHRDSLRETPPIGCWGPDCGALVDSMQPAIRDAHGNGYVLWGDSTGWTLTRMP